MSDTPTDPQKILPPLGDDGNTGKIQLIAQQTVRSEVNGAFAALEKVYKRAKLLITIAFAIIGSVMAIDHWIGSFARRDEVDQLNAKMTVLGDQMLEVRSTLKILLRTVKEDREEITP